MRILLPSKPSQIILSDDTNQTISAFTNSWDETSKTCLLKFENDSKGISVQLKW
jgi:hypothetical protein